MQLAPVVPPTSALPPSIINRPQQLTPASSVADEDHRHSYGSTTSSGASGNGYPEHRSSYHSSSHNRGRSGSDPRQDDYYFYHTGSASNSVMNSRRGSVQSIERGRPAEDAIDAKKGDSQVRLPPITSLFAAVEPAQPPPLAHVPQPPPPPPPQPPQSYHTPREHQNPHFAPRDPLPSQPHYSPPTSYPHIPPYRRQSIFSTYASSVTSAPQIPSYPPPSHHYPPPPHHSPHGSIPYRTPSPPLYQQRHVSIPPNYPPSSYHLQPRPPHPSSLITSRSGPSTFVLSHRTNSASPAERYMCHECNKSFSRPSSLRIHMFSHTGEKPFACSEPGCTKRFSVRSNMRRHMKVHTEQAMAESASDAGMGRGIGPSGYHTESVKDDEGASETSVTSPGLGITHRPRQGSRSSI